MSAGISVYDAALSTKSCTCSRNLGSASDVICGGQLIGASASTLVTDWRPLSNWELEENLAAAAWPMN